MSIPDHVVATFRNLLAEAGVPAPDEIQPQADGTTVALWYEQKLAVIIEPDDPAPEP